MKTEWVMLLTSPDSKAFLGAEARRERVSVAELLIHSRCESRVSEEEAVLAALAGALSTAIGEARRALQDGLDEAQSVFAELRDGLASALS